LIFCGRILIYANFLAIFAIILTKEITLRGGVVLVHKRFALDDVKPDLLVAKVIK
jgi:hypothetical protein